MKKTKISITNETRHETPFFGPFGKGYVSFFRKVDALKKALMLVCSKNLNFFTRTITLV